MKNGDISNKPAPLVGIRFERIIKTEEGKLNRAAKAFVQSLFSIDVSIAIVTSEDRRKCLAFLTKWGVPYSRVIDCTTFEIPRVCIENEMITYYDLDVDILQNVLSQGHKRVEAKQWTYQELL